MRDVRITCAAPGCDEFATVDRRHRDNLAGHWRCPEHDRERPREVPC